MAKKINYETMFTRRKDGLYMARYTDKNGRHSIYDRDPAKLFLKMQAIKQEQEKPVLFRDIAEDWERQHREEISVRTWNNYIHHYQELLRKHGNKSIEEVTAQDVVNHLAQAKASGYSATVVNTIRSLYRMIFDYAIIHEHIQYNPVSAVKLPRGLKRGKREAPSDVQIRKIFASADAPFGTSVFSKESRHLLINNCSSVRIHWSNKVLSLNGVGLSG